ncbi:hypothetical protein [Microbacterium laevaniformans]|uniref:hypothetical protein n=1 Tax=Microbacterium laevaniformans TaxID=36807 RepID=UPI003D99A4F5
MTTSIPSPTDVRASRTKKTLVAGAIVLGLATTVGVVTGASFTATDSVAGQSLGAGTIAVEAGTSASSAVINADDVFPGDVETTTIDLENTGTGDVRFVVDLDEGAGTDAVLAPALQATVTVGTESITRSLEDWQSGEFQIAAPLAAGASTEIEVSVELPTTTGNDAQGLHAGFTVRVDAIQAKNSVAPTGGWIAD